MRNFSAVLGPLAEGRCQPAAKWPRVRVRREGTECRLVGVQSTNYDVPAACLPFWRWTASSSPAMQDKSQTSHKLLIQVVAIAHQNLKQNSRKIKRKPHVLMSSPKRRARIPSPAYQGAVPPARTWLALLRPKKKPPARKKESGAAQRVQPPAARHHRGAVPAPRYAGGFWFWGNNLVSISTTEAQKQYCAAL